MPRQLKAGATVYRQKRHLSFSISETVMRDLEALAQEFALYRDALYYAKQREALERWRNGEKAGLNLSAMLVSQGKK
jgi:hypothetical protein